MSFLQKVAVLNLLGHVKSKTWVPSPIPLNYLDMNEMWGTNDTIYLWTLIRSGPLLGNAIYRYIKDHISDTFRCAHRKSGNPVAFAPTST